MFREKILYRIRYWLLPTISRSFTLILEPFLSFFIFFSLLDVELHSMNQILEAFSLLNLSFRRVCMYFYVVLVLNSKSVTVPTRKILYSQGVTSRKV